jgi:hypothetical protein
MLEWLYHTKLESAMARPKKLRDSRRVTIVLPIDQYDRLKYMCIQMSCQEKRLITPSEGMRMAIETAYPVPKSPQMDMFS